MMGQRTKMVTIHRAMHQHGLFQDCEIGVLLGEDEEIKSNAYSGQKHSAILSEALRNLSHSNVGFDDEYQESSHCLALLNLKQDGKRDIASSRLTLLRAGGVHGNYLLAGHIQPSEHSVGDVDEGDYLSLQYSVLHKFPTRICSIYSDNQEGTLQHGGNHRRICVRTISSTLFAEVNIETGMDGRMSQIQLVGLLEIMHGKSILPSGVEGRKKKAGFEQLQTARSNSSISDVMFHPTLGDQALTVDVRGTLGLYQAEIVPISSKRWTTHNRWDEISQADPTIVLPESDSYILKWSLDWLADADIAFLTCQKGIFTVHVPTKERKCIFIAPLGNRIWSCKLMQEPRPLLWITTTTDICILEADPDLEYRQLISFAHERSSQGGLYVTALDFQLTSQTVALWNWSSQFLLTYTVFVEGVHGPIHVQSRQDDLHTMKIGVMERRACPPLIVDASDHAILQQTQRRNQNLSIDDIDSARIVFELSSSGDVWISTIIQDEIQAGSKGSNLVKHLTQTTLPSNLEICAARSLHSLSEVYTALMKTAVGSGSSHGTDDLFERIDSALQDWPSMLEVDRTNVSTAVLPIELFASTLQGRRSEKEAKPLSLQACVVSQHLLYKQFLNSLDSFLYSVNDQGEERIKKTSFAPADILSESGHALKVEDIVEKLASPFHDLQKLGARTLKDSAANAHRLNIRTAAHEVAADLALTSISVMKTPVVDDSTSFDEEASANSQRRKGKHIPADVPQFACSFFKPTSRESAVSSTANTKTFQSRLGKVSLAAHLLLDEWTLGDDPAEYHFSHPYDDDEEREYMDYQNYSSGRTTPESNRSSSLRASQSRSRTSSQVPPENSYQGFGSSQFPRSSQTIESAPALLSNWGTHSRGNSNSSPFHFPNSSADAQPAPESAPQMETLGSQKQSSQKARKKRRVGGF
ncbi:uncharacterized protein FA14DRAFT_188097 [Meira miltonrushii]|uniref:RRN6 K-rich C-terminal domain-containing protein n=1 Tax=Meira miltonrushii TaxID=1280837 RepID=A0A316VLC2_9BASI|nr:uncharacterized protein FA14DRAFT_188097 [Meira miltonrushii]PWN38064.1 hypothetical protein FA14DRAFT_188097 [Meira miltonrushii]